MIDKEDGLLYIEHKINVWMDIYEYNFERFI